MEDISSAISGILIEAHKQGIDIQVLTDKVKSGLMGSEMYAPAEASKKTEQVTLMLSSLEHAEEIISITRA